MTLTNVRYCVGSWDRRRTDTHALVARSPENFSIYFGRKWIKSLLSGERAHSLSVFVSASCAASHTSSYFHNLFSASRWILRDTSVSHNIIFNWNMRQLGESAHKYKPNENREKKNNTARAKPVPCHLIKSSHFTSAQAQRMMGFMLLRLLFLHVSRECIKSKCVISIFITVANIFSAECSDNSTYKRFLSSTSLSLCKLKIKWTAREQEKRRSLRKKFLWHFPAWINFRWKFLSYIKTTSIFHVVHFGDFAKRNLLKIIRQRMQRCEFTTLGSVHKIDWTSGGNSHIRIHIDCESKRFLLRRTANVRKRVSHSVFEHRVIAIVTFLHKIRMNNNQFDYGCLVASIHSSQ